MTADDAQHLRDIADKEFELACRIAGDIFAGLNADPNHDSLSFADCVHDAYCIIDGAKQEREQRRRKGY